MTQLIPRSVNQRKTANTALVTNTTTVVLMSSSRDGKLAFLVSETVSDKKAFDLLIQLIILAPFGLMAGQEGLEPPTCGFGDRCSAN
jgi:hypothetical protein